MKIDKIYNNNVVQIIDEQGQEVIVMGRGLGFGKKIGDELTPDLIEKTFVSQDTAVTKEWYQIYDLLTPEELQVVLEIIDLAEERLGQELDLAFYLALADHLHYAIERTQQGLSLKNPLAWEIRKFYPTEYALGLEVLGLIAERLTVSLAEDEAASLALHFVNAQKDSGLVTKNHQMTQIVIAILEIVRLYYGSEAVMAEHSVNYNRFVTHVQYFAQRVTNGLIQGNNDAFLYEQVQENYPKAYTCTQKIKTYIQEKHDFDMSLDEEVYMTIHIQRLTSN